MSFMTRVANALRRAAPTGASTPAQVVGIGSTGTRRSSSALLAMYNTHPWVRAIEGKVASSVAAQPWTLSYPAKKSSEKVVRRRIEAAGLARARHAMRRKMEANGELVEVAKHPLLDLVAKPNPLMMGSEAIKVTQIWIDIPGDGAWLLERDGLRTPVAFWPIPPKWISRMPTPADPTWVLNLPGGPQTVPASEVIFFRDIDPSNPYQRGAGLWAAAGDELVTDELASKLEGATMNSGGRKTLLISGAELSPDSIRRAEIAWRGQSNSFWSIFKPLWATWNNDKVEVSDISTTVTEMKLLELRDAKRDLFLNLTGMPPEILGIVENSNRATSEVADYILARHVTTPRLEYLRAVLQAQLASQFDERLILDYESPIQDDAERHLKAMGLAPWAAKIDEWREAEGLEPLGEKEGGGGFVMSFTNDVRADLKPVESAPVVEPVVTPPAAPASPPPAPPEEDPAAGSADEAAQKSARSLLIRSPRRIRGYTPAQLVAVIARIADRVAPALRKRILAALDDVHGAVDAGRIVTALDDNNARGVLDAIAWEPFAAALAKMREEQGKAFLRAGVVSAQVLAEQTGQEFAFDEARASVSAWIASRAGAVTAAMVQTSRLGIETMVAAVLAGEWPGTNVQAAALIKEQAGLAAPQAHGLGLIAADLIAAGASLAEELPHVSASMRVDRASTAGSHESFVAAQGGRGESWSQAQASGVLSADAEQTWVTEEDEAVCPVCFPMDGQTVKLGEPFIGGDNVKYHNPGDPHIKCLVGESRVSSPGGRIEAAAKRLFEGQVVVLRTRDGKSLSCTSNHPVLTPSGWKAAEFVNVGDQVVCIGGANVARLADHNSQNVPSSIEDVARALEAAPGVLAVEVPVAPEDFHGDGEGSDVAVVWTDRLLASYRDSRFGDGLGDSALGRTAVAAVALSGEGALDLPLDRRGATAHRCVRCGSALLPQLGADLGGVDVGLFTRGAHGDALPAEPGQDRRAVDVEHLREAEHGSSLTVEPGDSGVRQYHGAAKWNAATMEPLVEGGWGGAEVVAQLSRDFASEVSLDEVVDRSFREFRGHVFNLQTSVGWYVAEGIVTHNCRCGVLVSSF